MPMESSNNANNAVYTSIWKIRDSIQSLEDLKNQIIDFLDIQNQIDASNTELWITDVKELYYNIVAAWEMLSAVSRGNLTFGHACSLFIETAKSRLEQVVSELQVFKDKTIQIEPQLRTIFNNCVNSISSELNILLPDLTMIKSPLKGINDAESSFEFTCSVCGEPAIVFFVGPYPFSSEKEPCLIYRGITRESYGSLEDSNILLALLENGKVADIHSYVIDLDFMEDGLDAYCPSCDAIYCQNHYITKEYWDQGFYDYTEGTCPEGHT